MTNLHRSRNPNLRWVGYRLYRLGEMSRAHRRRVDVIFVNDHFLSKLAGKFRGSHGATDVLAFDYGGDASGEMPVGEIVISLDAAARQAFERRNRIENELLLLIVHGLLHLGGQGDETHHDWLVMRRREFETLMKIL